MMMRIAVCAMLGMLALGSGDLQVPGDLGRVCERWPDLPACQPVPTPTPDCHGAECGEV